MRKHMVTAIFKKEILDLLRDKKTMFIMIILPIILYPLLMIGGSQIAMLNMNTTAEKEHSIVLEFEVSEELQAIIDEYGGDYGKVKIVKSDQAHKDLEEDTISAYVEEEKIDRQINYKIYMKQAKEDSSSAAVALREIFSQYNKELVEDNIRNLGLDITTTLEPIISERVDISKGEEMAGYFLGMILPMMLVIGVILGATYPAADIMAGEKERGTLETLLTLPLTNSELIMGKYLAVAGMSVVTALLNILGIVLSLAYMIMTMDGQNGNSFFNNMDLSKMLVPGIIAFIGLILFALIISAVSMSVCSLASSYKEAQNYISPIMLIGILPSYITMIPSVELTNLTAIIPIANVALLIKGVFTFEYDIFSMGLVLISNLAFVLISIWILTKMYSSENVLFSNGKGFSFLERRSQIIGGKMPTMGDGIAVFGISLLLFIYIGTYLQVKLELIGVGLSQIIFIGLALAVAYYSKAPMRKTFRIKRPDLRHIIGGLFIWIASFIGAHLITMVFLYIAPQNLKALEGIEDILIGSNPIWLSLLIVAVLPAICEELLFRGYLLSASSGKDNIKKGIIISSLMFGTMHVYLIKILPTAILGAGFAYATYKSGSIFVGMILHFLNNGLAIVASYYPESLITRVLSFLEFDLTQLDIGKLLMLLALILGALAIGIFIYKEDKSEENVALDLD